MKVVYVAGPFRAPTPWRVELNIREAELYGLMIANAGGVPLIPHSMYRFFNGECTDEFWLEGTKELLRRCDAVLLLPLWDRSEGSRGEKQLAEEMKLPVFDLAVCSFNRLCQWLDTPETDLQA